MGTDPLTVDGLRDPDAYLRRIGCGAGRLRGEEGLRVLHRAHVLAIPFENLDPASGTPVSLHPADLEEKIVRRGRGGYCFEQNLVFKAALETFAVGEVTPMLGRVRMGRSEHVRPRTHLLLRVSVDGRDWHVDVGFGGDSLLAPIPFGPGPAVEQDGWWYRVVEDGPELVLQMRCAGEWVDQYGFVPEPAAMVDIEVSNWYVSTFPRSPFVSGLRIAVQEPGSRWSLNVEDGVGALTKRTPEAEEQSTVELTKVPELLASRFRIPGARLEGERILLDLCSPA